MLRVAHVDLLRRPVATLPPVAHLRVRARPRHPGDRHHVRRARARRPCKLRAPAAVRRAGTGGFAAARHRVRLCAAAPRARDRVDHHAVPPGQSRVRQLRAQRGVPARCRFAQLRCLQGHGGPRAGGGRERRAARTGDGRPGSRRRSIRAGGRFLGSRHRGRYPWGGRSGFLRSSRFSRQRRRGPRRA